METPKPYTYVIVRKDIPLHQQMVQSAHAAHYAGFRTKEPDQVCSLIMMEVENEWELFRAYRHLAMNDIQVVPFFEPDWDMGLSALATEPLFTKKQREPLRNFKLWSIDNGAGTDLTPEDLTEGPPTSAVLQNPKAA